MRSVRPPSTLVRLNNQILVTVMLALWIGAMQPGMADQTAGTDKVTLYLREDIRANQPNLLTLNGLYDFYLPLGVIQAGGRVGESASQVGTWAYKIEWISPKFWDHFKGSAKLVKNNNYVPDVTQDTIFVERIISSFKPFQGWFLLDDVGVGAESGVAQIFTRQGSTNVLPNTWGTQNVVPVYALKFTRDDPEGKRAYSFMFANFDIFDPYPSSQPFVQLEGSQEISRITYYAYVRYRWDTATEQFHSLYLTVGMDFPN